MQCQATHRNARISPRKVRIYRDLLKGRLASEADSQLQFMPGKAPQLVRAVLQSALANAVANEKATANTLRIADIIVDSGFVMKRARPGYKGSARPILKRTAHITVVVGDNYYGTKD